MCTYVLANYNLIYKNIYNYVHLNLGYFFFVSGQTINREQVFSFVKDLIMRVFTSLLLDV